MTPTRSAGIPPRCNFRDLGGYPAAGGRLPWRRLFRSGAIDALDDRESDALQALGLRTVIDLRSPHELTSTDKSAVAVADDIVSIPFVEPQPLPGANGIRTFFERRDAFLDRIARSAASSRRGPRAPEAGRKRARSSGMLGWANVRLEAELAAIYESVVRANSPALRRILVCLADTQRLPAVIQCENGKDRTGIAVAIVLTALGVGRRDVLADYRLTNRQWARDEVQRFLEVRGIRLERREANRLVPFFGVVDGAIDRVLQVIGAEPCGIETYLGEELGFAPNFATSLRASIFGVRA